MTDLAHSRIHIIVIILCIGINVIYSLYRPDYIVLFIAASFYLNMFYFIILLIPQNVKKIQVSKTSISPNSGTG